MWKSGVVVRLVGMYDGFVNRFWVILIIIVAVVFAVWQTWLAGPESEAEKKIKAWEAAMRADNFGGKTPDETLKMFVAALRAGDMEQASRFFLLDEEGSREKWVEELNEAKELGRIEKIISFLSNVTSAPEEITSESDFKFRFNDEGNIGFLDLELNTFSGVWKIEDF